jgi:hypothetical protein
VNIQQYYSKNRLTISEYYQIIKQKLESNDYSLSERPNEVGYTTSSQRDINPHLEAINYLQWEFMSDRKDPRIDKVFSDICIPNGVNGGDLDVDFSNYSVEEFLKEIMKLKN